MPNGDYLSIISQAFVLHSLPSVQIVFKSHRRVRHRQALDFKRGVKRSSAWTKVFEIEDTAPEWNGVRTFHASGITTAHNRHASSSRERRATAAKGVKSFTIGELRYYGYEHCRRWPGQDIVFKHHANVPTKDFLHVRGREREQFVPGSGDVTDIATVGNAGSGAPSGSVALT